MGPKVSAPPSLWLSAYGTETGLVIRQKQAFLSVEFLFRQGSPSLTGTRTGENLTYSVLAHRNGLDTRVSAIIRTCVAERSKKDPPPAWISRLLPSETSTEEKQLEMGAVYLLSEPPTRPREPRKYHTLDQSRTLRELLKGRSFVECPTIEVMSPSDYDAITTTVAESTAAHPDEILADNAALHDDSGSEDETRHRRKRRKLDPDAGKRLLRRLLAYGSDDTSGSDGEAGRLRTGDTRAGKPSVFDALGDYESDDLQSSEEEESEAAEEVMLPAAQSPQASACSVLMGGPAPPRRGLVSVDNEDVNDEVDWGGSDSDM